MNRRALVGGIVVIGVLVAGGIGRWAVTAGGGREGGNVETTQVPPVERGGEDLDGAREDHAAVATTSPPTSTPGALAGESEDADGASEDGDAPLAADALLGVPFGEEPDGAIDAVIGAAGGTLASDTVERASDAGSSGFPCHGPNGAVSQEIRHATIEGDRVTLTLYIADGSFMGYEVAGQNPRYVTPEGVGLGSDPRDLLAAYPDRVTIQPGLGELERWASVEDSGSPAPLQFDYEEGQTVHRVIVGGRCAS